MFHILEKYNKILCLCCRLNTCVLKFICWNLISDVMVFRGVSIGRCLGHEATKLMSEVSDLIKETWENFLAFFTTWIFSQKTAIYEVENSPSLDITSVGILIMGFQASGANRNKRLLFKSPTLWYFCYSGLNKLRKPVISWLVTGKRI